MKKSEINSAPSYFDKYINLADDIELSEALQKSLDELESLEMDRFNAIGDMVYATGKWTIKEIFQHLIDVERILSYRALLIARNDKTRTSGFDPEFLSKYSKANSRNLYDIVDEMKFVRLSTSAMFNSFDDEQLQRTGINWKYEMPVAAIGFTIVGHQIHHFKILEEKYYPLVSEN